MMSLLRASRALLAAAIASASVVAVSASAPVATALSSGVVTFEGAGNGHGYGLSQWGAYGYAVEKGWSASQILGHYYNNTFAGTQPLDTIVGIRLQNLDGAQTAVVSQSGRLEVAGVAAGPFTAVVARPLTSTTYRVWARNDGERCPDATTDPGAAGWTLVADSVGPEVIIRPTVNTYSTNDYRQMASVCEPTGKVRTYRGSIVATHFSAGEVRTVNRVRVEHYLRAVIAKEMSPGWATAGGGKGAQALQAQAVAARSFAMAETRYLPYARTCDLSCQAYYGAAMRTSLAGTFTATEHPATDAAVLATAGMVRRVGSATGPVALTMFSASTGGYTVDGVGALMPYKGVLDEGDSVSLNPKYRWTDDLPVASIESAYPSIGTYRSIEILERNGVGEWGGRVLSMRINGSAGSVVVTGDQFRYKVRGSAGQLVLVSNWFRVVDVASEPPPECGDRIPPALDPTLPAFADVPAARLVASTPERFVDTRLGRGSVVGELPAGCTLVVDPGYGSAITAVVANVTAVRPAASGRLTAYACGRERPAAVTLRAVAGRVVAASSIVPLGSGGALCVHSDVDTHVLVDLSGRYSTARGQMMEPLPVTRLLDTRSSSRVAAGSITRVAAKGVGKAPAGAVAAALTVHALGSAADGYLTVFPCSSTVPASSSLNVTAALPVTNHVQVRLDVYGGVCIYSSTSVHVVVDMSAWFGSGATASYRPLEPARLLDTRDGTGGVQGTVASEVVVDVAGVSGLPEAAGLRAVVGTVAALAPLGEGYLTVHDCRTPAPQVSMVRFPVATAASNTVVGPDDGSGRWCVLPSTSTHLVVDVTGYFA
ncbi:MAG: hypothetical protein RJB65_1455 [Actinomycetota bacterium]